MRDRADAAKLDLLVPCGMKNSQLPPRDESVLSLQCRTGEHGRAQFRYCDAMVVVGSCGSTNVTVGEIFLILSMDVDLDSLSGSRPVHGVPLVAIDSSHVSFKPNRMPPSSYPDVIVLPPASPPPSPPLPLPTASATSPPPPLFATTGAPVPSPAFAAGATQGVPASSNNPITSRSSSKQCGSSSGPRPMRRRCWVSSSR